MNFSIGGDPEAFLATAEGKFKSAIGLIGGTKKEPRQVEGMEKGFCVQEDNVAAEFNIPPATTADAFARNIQQMVDYLERRASALKLRLRIVPSARFDPSELTGAQALTFGCDADFDAWTGKQNPKPACDDPQLRTCGGHVTVGTRLPSRMCIKAEDLYLGVPSVMLDRDTRRRVLYGKAGAFRETPFGHEYRVLSNFWIARREYCEWVYQQVNLALTMVYAAQTIGIDEDDFLEEDRDVILAAINTGDTEPVQALDKKYGILKGAPLFLHPPL